MARKNSNVIVENGKVVFSKEILDYFENLRNEENSEWIDKYFEVLSNSSNFDALKFNIHHIRPCFTFKDNEHTKRKETKSLGDKFNGNLIKLSIYNHILAHHCLWKIFDNWDSKNTFQHMCGIKIYIENLSENELCKIASLREECVQKNRTKEELSEYNKKYYKEHKDEFFENNKKYYNEHKNERKEYRKIYQKEHKNETSEYQKNYREEHKNDNEWKEYHKNYSKKWNQDNKERVYEKHKKYNEEHKDELTEYYKQWEKENKEKRKEQHKIYDAQKCIDPIVGDKCTYGTLRTRKYRNKEKYKGVIVSKCIINDMEISISI